MPDPRGIGPSFMPLKLSIRDGVYLQVVPSFKEAPLRAGKVLLYSYRWRSDTDGISDRNSVVASLPAM